MMTQTHSTAVGRAAPPRPTVGRVHWVAALALPVAVASLAAAGQTWRAPSSDGGVGAAGRWAVGLAVAWGAWALLALATAGPPPPDEARDRVPRTAGERVADTVRRLRPLVAVVAAALTAGALLPAVARLVAALTDDTTLVRHRTAPAAWVAPAVLVVLLAAVLRLARHRGLLVAGAVLGAGAAVVGAVTGPAAHRAPGVLTRPGRAADGARAGTVDATDHSLVGATALAARDGLVFVGLGTRVIGIDQQARWFPYADVATLAPAAYTGHRAGARDAVLEIVGLVARPGELVVASADGVFTVPERGPSRLVAALAADRTSSSLAALAADGVPVLRDGTRIVGLGADGSGGLLVATDAVVTRITAAGSATVLEGTRAAFPATGDTNMWRAVHLAGRADGSAVLVVPCELWEVAADGSATRADGVSAGCRLRPPMITLDGRGELAVGSFEFGPRWLEGGPRARREADGDGLVAADGSDALVVLGADGDVARVTEREAS